MERTRKNNDALSPKASLAYVERTRRTSLIPDSQSQQRVDTVRRAKAVLAVSAGEPFTVAAALSGFKSADSVSQLVERFNQQGLAALSIAAGRGRKPTYTSSQRQQILEQLRSTPNREQDQSATWSLRIPRLLSGEANANSGANVHDCDDSVGRGPLS